MSSLIESTVTHLEANSTITAELASANAIYPGLPQSHDGFPVLTVELIDDDQLYGLSGAVNETALGFVRINVWSTSVKACNDVATVIKSELNAFRGTFGAHTAEHIRKERERQMPTEPDTGLNRVYLDFRIAYY